MNGGDRKPDRYDVWFVIVGMVLGILLGEAIR